MSQPNLQTFIFRSQALQLYRKFLRTVRNAPSSARGELQAHIKQEFRKAAGDEEVYGMKYRLSEGRVQLRQLSETLGMTSA